MIGHRVDNHEQRITTLETKAAIWYISAMQYITTTTTTTTHSPYSR